MHNRTIGILGGKGPEATVELMRLIVRHTPVLREEDHCRMVVDNNPKIPKPSLAIEGKGDSPIDALVETARNVERAGADFIVIPCNSAHYYIDAIRNAVRVPVVSIIDETVRAVKNHGSRCAGLLASTGLVRSGLYQRALAGAGIETAVPDDESQNELMNNILRFKDTGELAPLTRTALALCEEMIKNQEVDAIIYACTEIPLALAGHKLKVPAFDTIDVLARACAREARDGDLP